MTILKIISFKRIATIGLILFLYSYQVLSKTVVISDIDDTLKKANSVGKATEQAYHFLLKIPYIEMRDLFNEIRDNEIAKSESINFYYVSAAYQFTFNAPWWLKRHHFPVGNSTLKTVKHKESTYIYKYNVIKAILENEIKSLDKNNNEILNVLMFGDNASADAIVYSKLTLDMRLNSEIYIRDVKAEATFFDTTVEVKKIPGVKYYFSEVELFNNSEFGYLSQGLKNRAYESYRRKELIPNYTLRTLTRRLNNLYNDKVEAHDNALKFWDDYYLRF